MIVCIINNYCCVSDVPCPCVASLNAPLWCAVLSQATNYSHQLQMPFCPAAPLSDLSFRLSVDISSSWLSVLMQVLVFHPSCCLEDLYGVLGPRGFCVQPRGGRVCVCVWGRVQLLIITPLDIGWLMNPVSPECVNLSSGFSYGSVNVFTDELTGRFVILRNIDNYTTWTRPLCLFISTPCESKGNI